jgi:spore coat polysaccharide biosynthesis predicted glycosyltransferase SpsG
MNRQPILFRVDAGGQAGYERLARCLILSAALQRRRRPTSFLSQLEPRHLALQVKRIGNDWTPAEHPVGSLDDLGQVLQQARKLRPAALILDADAPQEYVNELAATGAMLVTLDHQGMLHFPGRLLVNPLLGPSRETFEFNPGTQVLMGRRFTLVRPEVRRHRPTRAQEPAPLPVPPGKAGNGQFRALVSLGEDDPHRQTMELAKMMLATPKVGKVDVVVRREHPDLEKLQELATQHPERLEIALEPAEVVARIVRCHFALTSGSGWSLELACVGVPQLLILQNESHWPSAQRLEEEGCANCLGWHENVSAQTIRLAVQNLLTDPLERQAMARCGRKLVDGRGADRIVNGLEIMLHSPARRAGVVEMAA